MRVRRGTPASGRAHRLAATLFAVCLGVGLGTGIPGLSLDGAAAKKPGAGGGRTLKKEAIFSKVAPATVLIFVPQQNGASLGSGVIIDKSGLVVTNAHVVAPSRGQVQVFLYDPREKTQSNNLKEFVAKHTPLMGRVVKRGPGADLALIRLPTLPQAYPIVEIGDSEGISPGQDVVAIGNPHGLSWSLTSGAVSALRTDAIQTDAAINPGNSGGPLVDMRGRLVGINTFIRKDSEGLGFAIPVKQVKEYITKYGTNTEVEPPPPPRGLIALLLMQDLSKLKELNTQRQNRGVARELEGDLDKAQRMRQALVSGDLTPEQVLLGMRLMLQAMGAHNRTAQDDVTENFQRQLDQTVEHLKDSIQISR
jgi:S1-C subfamily serine protease